MYPISQQSVGRYMQKGSVLPSVDFRRRVPRSVANLVLTPGPAIKRLRLFMYTLNPYPRKGRTC
jgi:hypothetical protein